VKELLGIIKSLEVKLWKDLQKNEKLKKPKININCNPYVPSIAYF